MRVLTLLFCSISMLYTNSMNAQTVLLLYEGVIPNSKPSVNKERSATNAAGILRISKVSVPTLTMYVPKKQSEKRSAVIVCPGGGYGILAVSHEGTDVAKAFNEMGITAFVLKYRLPDDSIMVNKSIGPLQDAQRAIQLVRENAQQFNIDGAKIGIMGFSAGGHLAASASTRFTEQLIENPKQTSQRPDFSVLIYPFISFMDGITHKGSRMNLLGKIQTLETLQKFSNELRVTEQTPPAFLVHAGDDPAVPVANSISYYEALLKQKIYSNMIIYPRGGHGFGMNNKTTKDKYMLNLQNWLNSINLL